MATKKVADDLRVVQDDMKKMAQNLVILSMKQVQRRKVIGASLSARRNLSFSVEVNRRPDTQIRQEILEFNLKSSFK